MWTEQSRAEHLKAHAENAESDDDEVENDEGHAEVAERASSLSRCHLESPHCVGLRFKPIIQDVECVRESYPGFEKTLDEFVSSKRVRVTTPVISSLTPAKTDEE